MTSVLAKEGLSAVVLVDKPVGPTSFAMVRAARRAARGRVGHAGTLDPFASGLLLVLVGQATRISALLMELPKEYEMTVQFGAVSSTADPTGEITSTGKRTDAAAILAALERFRGRISQRVPLTSAVKVDGEPSYRRAHRGEVVETPEREVAIYDLTLVEFDEELQQARLIILAGKGAYMRVLADDLGLATEAGAYAASLRRTRVGPFSVEQAVQPHEFSREGLQPGQPGVLSLDEALAFLPRYDLNERDARRATNGNELQGAPLGRYRVYGNGCLLGVYEGRGGVARPVLVFGRTP
ncbi:MAG: tRNA pseudouridine(55) synthase TruB [Thermoleophilia bacterium]|nr:tRNA pseudouridine(55) synthase TruB [Thermoleophilia bacterium]